MIVKVCGITTVSDALGCIDAGVDWLGLNFVPGSKRRISTDAARAIVAAVRGRASVVGVVADLTRDALAQLEREVGLDRLQLHGDEPPELLRALGARAFKAVRVGAPEDVDRARAYDGLLLLDAKVPGELGGTGRPVDRTLAAALAAERPVLLAGGLGPDNVREAALAVRPWGVDTASGVELSPGVKDLAAVARFVREARP